MHQQAQSALGLLGVQTPLAGLAIGGLWSPGQGELLTAHSPIDGEPSVELAAASSSQVGDAIAASRVTAAIG